MGGGGVGGGESGWRYRGRLRSVGGGGEIVGEAVEVSSGNFIRGGVIVYNYWPWRRTNALPFSISGCLGAREQPCAGRVFTHYLHVLDQWLPCRVLPLG